MRNCLGRWQLTGRDKHLDALLDKGLGILKLDLVLGGSWDGHVQVTVHIPAPLAREVLACAQAGSL